MSPTRQGQGAVTVNSGPISVNISDGGANENRLSSDGFNIGKDSGGGVRMNSDGEIELNGPDLTTNIVIDPDSPSGYSLVITDRSGNVHTQRPGGISLEDDNGAGIRMNSNGSIEGQQQDGSLTYSLSLSDPTAFDLGVNTSNLNVDQITFNNDGTTMNTAPTGGAAFDGTLPDQALSIPNAGGTENFRVNPDGFRGSATRRNVAPNVPVVSTLPQSFQSRHDDHVAVFNVGRMSSGLYMYRLDAGDFVETKYMLVVK